MAGTTQITPAANIAAAAASFFTGHLAFVGYASSGPTKLLPALCHLRDWGQTSMFVQEFRIE
jgi:hypothetical protein